MSTAFDLLLAALVVAVAVWIISTRDSFASVVGIVAYGLLLALVWVRIVAPDVALTEVDAPPTGRRWLRALLVLGPIVFLVIGFAGFAVAGGFLAYPVEFAKPIIMTIEVVLMLSIAVMLGLLVAGPPRRRQR